MISNIRDKEHYILSIGLHAPIIQSIADFDYLCGRSQPSIAAIITASRKSYKVFFGAREVIIPCFSSFADVPKEIATTLSLFLNVSSARRAIETSHAVLEAFPHLDGGHIFAEGIPEAHALTLYHAYKGEKIIAGPAGVGLLVPGALKLGAIGGTTSDQITKNSIALPGNVAVISASGGMSNEIIATLARDGRHISFALCVGGDRFPFISPLDACRLAQNDPATQHIVYYGELGGRDEYDLAAAVTAGEITKPITAYIAGVVDEAFDGGTQFGHAKALAQTADESAKAKQEVLARAGVQVGKTYKEFTDAFADIARTKVESTATLKERAKDLSGRRATVFTAREILDPFNTDHALDAVREGRSIAPHRYVTMVQEALLGRSITSKILPLFTETVYEILIDHGPHVSGAVNTMVTARAGKNMIDSLCAGLLTIGPRFGGAINDAAECWFTGVTGGMSAQDFVEMKSQKKEFILGIGHKKYRVGMPDPRVRLIKEFAAQLGKHPFLDFALAIESITTQKKGNLILNVDGIVAALMMDILQQEENYTHDEIKELIEVEYFNTFFIVPRSIGFIAHFLEQKRNDEGLFRLPDDLVHMK